MHFLQLIRRQDGIALVMALGVLIVLTIVGSTSLYYASANERSARQSGASEGAYSLAEAGLANAISTLANASDPAVSNLLSSTTVNLGTGTATYAGVLLGTTWTITSTGKLANPTGSTSAQVSRTLTRNVEIAGLDIGSLAGDWDRIHQESNSTCFNVPVDLPARVTAKGNLCLLGGNIIGSSTKVSVGGNVTLGAGTSSNTVKSAGAGAGWTNSGNVTASDNVYATTTVNGLATSPALDSSTFGFGIPSDATITGITARIEKNASVANTIQDLNVRLLKNGAPAGTDKAATGTNWGTVDAYTTYGTSSDLWGTTWTPADVNASNFGLRLVGTNSGTTASSSIKNAGTGTGASWTTPSNIVSSNNIYATQSLAAGITSGTLDATNFGFALPSNAVVTGVSARIEKKASVSSTIQDLSVYLLKAGAQTGSNKAATGTYWTTSDAYRTYGAAGDMWGATLTPADVNASNFGFRLVAKNFSGSSSSTASIDHMELTVYYDAYNTSTASVDHMEITVYWSGANTHIGTSGTPVSTVDVVGTCKLLSNPAHTPCSSADNVFSNTITTTNTVQPKPTVDFNYWYNNASPGPKHPCTQTSGTPPVFDNDTTYNGLNPEQELSVENATDNPGPFGGTTGTDKSYICRVKDAQGNVTGELSWNMTTRVLTVKGTIFFDGDAVFHDHNGYIVHYQGRGTLFIAGKWHNDEVVCAGGSGYQTSCRSAANMPVWDPSTNMLVLIVGDKNVAGSNDWSFHKDTSAFQGILYAQHTCPLDETAMMSGPLICDVINILGTGVTFYPWPALPAAAPGQIYSGGTKLDKQLILGQQSG